jgi:hypothetical protein
MMTIEALRKQTVLKSAKTKQNNMLDSDEEFDLFFDEDEEE